MSKYRPEVETLKVRIKRNIASGDWSDNKEDLAHDLAVANYLIVPNDFLIVRQAEYDAICKDLKIKEY